MTLAGLAGILDCVTRAEMFIRAVVDFGYVYMHPEDAKDLRAVAAGRLGDLVIRDNRLVPRGRVMTVPPDKHMWFAPGWFPEH